MILSVVDSCEILYSEKESPNMSQIIRLHLRSFVLTVSSQHKVNFRWQCLPFLITILLVKLFLY